MPRPGPQTTQPKLSKTELAALDFLIADAEERSDTGLLSSAFWTAFVREALLMAIRRAILTRIQRRFIDDLGPIRDKVSAPQIADLNKELQDVVLGTPTVEQLVDLRKSLGVKD